VGFDLFVPFVVQIARATGSRINAIR